LNENNLLIVGGYGSIGKALIRSLDADHIYILDKQILKNTKKNMSYFECDMLNFDLLEEIISKLPSNLMVIYLVGNLSTDFNPNQIRESYDDNVIALSNFLNLAKPKISHFVFISTISVYGMPLNNPIRENHPINPLSLYGCGKAAAEILCNALCVNYKIPLTILRLTQLYGLDSAHNAFPHILLDAIKSRDFSKIKINPHIERDYLHISDFIYFLQILIKQPKQGIFNIGFGKSVNLLNLIKSITSFYEINLDESKILGYSPSFSLTMDISFAKEIFNFEPKQKIDLWLKNELKP
jgi:UDP-glucose 4-epimerase